MHKCTNVQNSPRFSAGALLTVWTRSNMKLSSAATEFLNPAMLPYPDSYLIPIPASHSAQALSLVCSTLHSFLQGPAPGFLWASPLSWCISHHPSLPGPGPLALSSLALLLANPFYVVRFLSSPAMSIPGRQHHLKLVSHFHYALIPCPALGQAPSNSSSLLH